MLQLEEYLPDFSGKHSDHQLLQGYQLLGIIV